MSKGLLALRSASGVPVHICLRARASPHHGPLAGWAARAWAALLWRARRARAGQAARVGPKWRFGFLNSRRLELFIYFGYELNFDNS